MTNAIGQLKTTVKVYCEICGCSSTRNISENVYENTKEAIEKAKGTIIEKAAKKYTCRICKSIVNAK